MFSYSEITSPPQKAISVANHNSFFYFFSSSNEDLMQHTSCLNGYRPRLEDPQPTPRLGLPTVTLALKDVQGTSLHCSIRWRMIMKKPKHEV